MKTMMIGIALSLAALVACNLTDKSAAESSAKEFSRQIPGATGILCADQDTDQDGYVSCTVFRGNEDPLVIQCGSETYCWNCARGCKYTPFYGGSKPRIGGTP